MSRLKSYLAQIPRGTTPTPADPAALQENAWREAKAAVRLERPMMAPLPEPEDLPEFAPNSDAWDTFVRGE